MRRRDAGTAALAVALLGLAAGPAGAATPAEPGAAPTEGPVDSQALAAAQLERMARFLAALPGFEVRLASSHDVVQPDGQKIEFSELRAVALARPDRLRVEQLASDGSLDLVIFDGRNLTVADGAAGVYAQVPQPGSLDDALLYFTRELGMPLPLAPLLSSRLPAELATHLRQIDYVEYTELLAQPAHHVAGRAAAVDFQVWIADGEQPLPLRIVLTYRDEPGQPQFRAQFLDWKLQPPSSASLFRFEAPPGARPIAFVAQVPVAPDPTAAGPGAPR